LDKKSIFSSDDLVEINRLTVQEGMSSRKIAEKYGVCKSTIGNLLRKETYTGFWEEEDAKPTAGGNIHNPLASRKPLVGNKFVFSSVQNNTFVHDGFLKTLLSYCAAEGAELICGRYLYNKNGYQGGKSDVWFDPKIRPYLLVEGRTIAKDLVWCGELNILPSAVNPLSGLQNYTNEQSSIVPHAKMQLESMPTPKHDAARLMYTTGTLTQRNYINRKEGQKASHDHIFGAVVVEVDEDGDWFVRQLHAESDTGSFYDLDTRYEPTGKVTRGIPIEGVNYGDLHSDSIAPEVEFACWEGEGNILDALKPKYQLLNDALSQSRRNHHNIKCPLYMFRQFNKKEESVEEEVFLTTKLIEKLDRAFSKRVVVDSNHDRALAKFLIEQDFKKDPVNAIFMLKMLLATYESVGSGSNFHTFEYACRLVNSNMNNVLFLREDESFKIAGNVECGSHSDSGNNGGRGSILSFQKLGTKHNIGHSHSCGIKAGVYQSGMSGDLDQKYNKGGSSWSHSHILTYQNGKRTIITQKGKKWRG
jgi:hypothetical protein